jgi:CDP-diacylglycerol pyrophosphatase
MLEAKSSGGAGPVRDNWPSSRISPIVFVVAWLAPCFAAAAPAQAPLAAGSQAACVIARPPNSLWSLARCCAANLHSNPACRAYDEKHDLIILKDNSPAKPDAYLIIPATRVTGVEDPQIFVPPVADFWAYGWQRAQLYIKRPPAEIGLAINSEYGRTQDQLHIHISCVREDVASVLNANQDRIGIDPARPVELPLGPSGNLYRVVKTTSLAAASPFDLAAAMPGARDAMAAQSIAVAGSKTPGVYFVLDTYHHDGNPGAAEELLDQSCRQS